MEEGELVWNLDIRRYKMLCCLMTNINHQSPKGIDLDRLFDRSLWTIDLRLDEIIFSLSRGILEKRGCEEITKSRSAKND
jgi:hypothetical protein